MTEVGHSLTGLAIGCLSVPARFNKRAKAVYLLGFAALANVPDFPIKGWGHDLYHVSHSLAVNALIIAALIGILRVFCRRFSFSVPKVVVFAAACAWLSHLVLDSFYCHGHGIRIFWPFSSTTALNLAVPWFKVKNVHVSPLDWYNLRISLIEFASYSPLVIACVVFRRIKEKCCSTQTLPRR